MAVLFISHYVFFTLFFLWGLLKNDFSVADIAWGLSFVLIFAVGTYLNLEALSLRQVIVGSFVLLWALRLSGYILYRNLKTGKEDFRYQQMRAGWKNEKLTAYTRVFLFQGVLSLLFGYPLFMLHGAAQSEFYQITDLLGMAGFIIGFFWESIADLQKNAFKNDPANKDKLCMVGLWRYSRYPNYFGEMLLWWSLILIISTDIAFYKILWGPFLLSFFMIKVSGVAMLDRKYESHPDFENYKNKTNTLIPGPVRG